ncbi:gpW family head-tail joining protein [Martelella soudanensis]|uniref:gpW family head-tail joining protein n=1 Tax=unclassified Martelella TaxID=2629616 RepID=UPI0015DD7734|nr:MULTISPECIES: gpW family head-tail joining protein [unclassified Martelella]
MAEEQAISEQTAVPQTPQERLRDAQLALHKLEIGQSVVTISYEGESVSYTAANRTSLQAYIRRLQAELGVAAQASPRIFNIQGRRGYRP